MPSVSIGLSILPKDWNTYFEHRADLNRIAREAFFAALDSIKTEEKDKETQHGESST